jgi:site-specific DNA-methyltransferase (adenine-specific)
MERLSFEDMNKKMGAIHNEDCLSFMKQVPDNYFDLVLTDPPYGIGMDGKVGIDGAGKAKEYTKKEWDKDIPSKEVFDEIKRISKHQIIWGGNYFIEALDNSPCWLFWDKNNKESFFADGEMAWTNYKTAVRKYTHTWHGFIQQDMANKEERHHPTQKPTELFKAILRDYAIKLDKKTIFDPFMGSGTTAIACKSLGLEWCGCELEADYVAIANKRLEAVQGSLF